MSHAETQSREETARHLRASAALRETGSFQAVPRRRRVAQPFFAAALRDALVWALPPFRPPFRAEACDSGFPRPDPDFFPPPDSLFTVAQARLSASLCDTPRSSYPSAMWSALRRCFGVYEDLSPRGISTSR